LNPYALSGASTSIEKNGVFGEEPSGIGGDSAGPLPTAPTAAGDSLAIAFDALSAALRAAIGAGDRVAVARLRAALDALLAPLAGPPSAPQGEGQGGAP
jgi:hypothetical protein